VGSFHHNTNFNFFSYSISSFVSKPLEVCLTWPHHLSFLRNYLNILPSCLGNSTVTPQGHQKPSVPVPVPSSLLALPFLLMSSVPLAPLFVLGWTVTQYGHCPSQSPPNVSWMLLPSRTEASLFSGAMPLWFIPFKSFYLVNSSIKLCLWKCNKTVKNKIRASDSY
jgi:hypothetical protein